MSTAYYALFHCLCGQCADLLIGGSGAQRNLGAWKRMYRAIDHGTTRKACEDRRMMPSFPQGIQDFADSFVEMQAKRHAADYDPSYRLTKTEVLTDIRSVEAVLTQFLAEPASERRAFVAHVLFKQR